MNFGKTSKKDVFYLDESFVFLNHGSYGSVPKTIEEKRHNLQLEMEKCPDIWFRYTSFDLWNKNRVCLAKFLRISDENLVLVENATDGINAVLKSINLEGSRDAILAQEFTYPAILNAIDYISKYRFKENSHIPVYNVPCSYPIPNTQSILDKYDQMCQEIIEIKKFNIKLVVLDHIASASATLFPVDKIIAILRKWERKQNDKIKILIDGAHSIGQIEINLSELDCDYYVSNLHKWFLAPRGCAFLYFRDVNDKNLLNPNIISHGYKKDATRNFFERATRDSTSWFVIEDCINFYENILGGIKTIHTYTSKLLDDAVDMLTTAWGTQPLEMPKEFEAPYMRVIHLPKLKPFSSKAMDDLNGLSYELFIYVFKNFQIIAVFPVLGDKLVCRISAYVYNSLEDYSVLCNAILRIKAE